jgi:hypothetical protein
LHDSFFDSNETRLVYCTLPVDKFGGNATECWKFIETVRSRVPELLLIPLDGTLPTRRVEEGFAATFTSMLKRVKKGK